MEIVEMFTKVKEIKEVKDVKEVNKLVKENWILLGIASNNQGSIEFFSMGRV